MIYLFQTTCYAAIFYGLYLLFVRNRAVHTWSRAWLLLSAVLPFVLPLIKLPGIESSFIADSGIYHLSLQNVTISDSRAVTAVPGYAWLPLGYAAVCAVLMGRIVAQYIWFARFVRRHTHDTWQGVCILRNTGIEPGSFGNYILLPGADTDEAILQHELAHIKLRHSADVLLLSVLKAIFWPNVMLYIIAHELRVVHEFQADARSAADKTHYMEVLLNEVFHSRRFSPAHTFFHHPLKRRIMMLQKTAPGRNGARAVALKTCGMAALLLAGIVWLQSCTPATEDISKPAVEPQAHQVVNTDSVEHLADGRDIYKFVDHAPETGYDLAKYLSDNIKYPASARKAGIEGRVIVKFVVDEDGNVRDATVLKAADPALGEEAVRVVNAMPKWQAGQHNGKKVSVYFHLPISFRLN